MTVTEILAQIGESPTPGSTPAAPGPGNAQTTAPPPTSPGRPPGSDSSMALLLGLMVAMFVFMWVMSSKRQKREQHKRAEMMAKLGKNDRVMTVGGVIGTVVSVKDKEVVLKVDESTNTKMTFARTAIRQVLEGDEVPNLDETR